MPTLLSRVQCIVSIPLGSKARMRFRYTWIIAVTLLAACSAPPVPTATPTSTATPQPATFTASAVPSRTPTPPPTSSPTPTWVVQGPDHVQVPIFMYHHIAESPIGSRYYVPPVKFEAQLKLLRDWEYTTISTSTLVESIRQGAALPPHPIIITFDDANEDNYTNAFPLMQKYGFTGRALPPLFLHRHAQLPHSGSDPGDGSRRMGDRQPHP